MPKTAKIKTLAGLRKNKSFRPAPLKYRAFKNPYKQVFKRLYYKNFEANFCRIRQKSKPLRVYAKIKTRPFEHALARRVFSENIPYY